MYEFLVGIVPFLGDSPDSLFSNIINEEVEYPTGDEALEPEAESLIRMLLEKNPVDRIGTIGSAPAVMAHPFFASLDFDSILRQKAEFIPQLENDEDTSYFDSRSDRYNHDTESPDEESSVPMFWSFSTASPRHSIVGGLDIPIGGLAALQAAHNAALANVAALEDDHGLDNPMLIRRISTATTATDEGVCSTASGGSNRSAFTVVPSSSIAAAKKDLLPPVCGSPGARSNTSLDYMMMDNNAIMPSVCSFFAQQLKQQCFPALHVILRFTVSTGE
jgi:serine/threonine protein kinase